jgi:hypothetical protein
VFEHDPYWQQSLARAARFIRYGALIVISVPTNFERHEIATAPKEGHYANLVWNDFLEFTADKLAWEIEWSEPSEGLETYYIGRNWCPIAKAYANARGAYSDIVEHLDTLRWHAATATSIVELGVRTAVSSRALVMGCPGGVQSYDLCPPPDDIVYALDDAWRFEIGDSNKIDIPVCDMLFIDTEHTRECLTAELDRHEERVRKKIILHDTVTFPDLLDVVNRKLVDPGRWKILEHHTNNNGLTVLERVL